MQRLFSLTASEAIGRNASSRPFSPRGEGFRCDAAKRPSVSAAGIKRAEWRHPLARVVHQPAISNLQQNCASDEARRFPVWSARRTKPGCRNGNRYLSHPVGPSSDNPKRRRILMKATALKTTLGGGMALALIGGATLASAPVSADPVKNAVYRNDGSGTAPSSSIRRSAAAFLWRPPMPTIRTLTGRPITVRRSLTCRRSSTRRPSPPTTMALR